QTKHDSCNNAGDRSGMQCCQGGCAYSNDDERQPQWQTSAVEFAVKFLGKGLNECANTKCEHCEGGGVESCEVSGGFGHDLRHQTISNTAGAEYPRCSGGDLDQKIRVRGTGGVQLPDPRSLWWQLARVRAHGFGGKCRGDDSQDYQGDGNDERNTGGTRRPLG